MTTIAWDGTTLAGDTLGVIGDSLKVTAVKIFRLDDGRLYGGSGKYDDVLAVLAWLNEGGDTPKVEHFAAILIETDGRCCRLEEQLVPMPIRERFHSVGSGRDFAMAAMTLGKTALDAVVLAAQWDVWTGGEVMLLTLADQDAPYVYVPAGVTTAALSSNPLLLIHAAETAAQAGWVPREPQEPLSWDERGTPYAPR